MIEAVAQKCSVKKVFLEIRKIHRKTPVPESLSLLKKRQVFSCEFCEISRNTFSYKIPPVAASGMKSFSCSEISSDFTIW